MPIIFTILIVIFLIFGVVVFRGSPYVPSQRQHIQQAFNDLYRLSKDDLLVDIGSGDGVVLREAAKNGARAVGFEINPILVLISRLLSRKYKNIEVKFADFWLTNIPDDTTVIYVFSVTRDVKKITRRIQEHVNKFNKPLHVIGYGSEFKEMKTIKNIGPYYLYLVEPLQPDKAQV